MTNSKLGRGQKLRLNSFARAVSLGLCSLLLAGCPASKETASKVVSGKLAIKGSNTLGEELIPRLVSAYKKDHPDVTFELESKGTASGFSAMLAGDCDI